MEFLTTGSNILLVILGFGVLILVHEAGHFLAAKWAGIRTEAFAIGMGPVVCAWRKGIGFAFGSTDPRAVKRFGKPVSQMTDAELDEHGVGETEYSLRWLPLGGFVKMLGQEDLNPAAVSGDARSYGRCPIGKRMIVVSAGVVMNLLLAVVLFIVCFLVGVRTEAPVIGTVDPDGPAGRAVATNAERAGVTTAGLQAGDRVLTIDGKEARSFADLSIAAAMGRPDVPLELRVHRAGVDEPLTFSILPERDAQLGLQSIGVGAAAGTTLALERDLRPYVNLPRELERVGLAAAGVQPGMTLLTVDGEPVRTWQQLDGAAERLNGDPVPTSWGWLAELDTPVESATGVVTALVPSEPVLAPQIYAERLSENNIDFEMGLLGLVPLSQIVEVAPGSDNLGILEPGDVILRIGSSDAPTQADVRATLEASKGRKVPMLVQRGAEQLSLEANVTAKGRLDVLLGADLSRPLFARPIERIAVPASGAARAAGEARESRPSAVAGLGLIGRSTIEAVDGTPVADWRTLRTAIARAVDARAGELDTTAERGPAETITVPLTVRPPTPGASAETVELALGPDDLREVRRLRWTTALSPMLFLPVETLLTANGNPLRAVTMGFEETHKMVLMTYLTIDRLVRGTVGVEQLRGPVGIVHMGTHVADRGFAYLLLFMAMISVNLAVLNFLPLPIVDGGLFLFLVYEKFRGRPPSIAFQNAATLAGLFLIGTLFLITFYNDVMRLVQ